MCKKSLFCQIILRAIIISPLSYFFARLKYLSWKIRYVYDSSIRCHMLLRAIMISKSLPSRFILLYHTFKNVCGWKPTINGGNLQKLLCLNIFVEKPKLFWRIGQFLVCPISKKRRVSIQLYFYHHFYL